MSLPDRVWRTVEQHAMFVPGKPVLVAVSGGPDSIALLHALHTLRGTWSISLVAAHLDHGFRGAESAADAEYVEQFCRRLGIPCRVAHEDVPEQKRRFHLSSQEAARRARHSFLRAVAQDVGAERIALGHTRNDRAETILLNIFRGTGPRGLEGFPPVRLPLTRPLYDVTRSETHAYCEKNSLQPRTDSSNASLKYGRNRLRLELLPYIADHYNPRIEQALLRLSDLIAAENRLLDQLAEQKLLEILLEHSPDQLIISASGLNMCALALRRRVLMLGILRLRGDLHGIAHDTIEAALAATEQGERFAMDLPHGESLPCRIEGQNERLCLVRRTTSLTSPAWSVPLPLEGRVDLPHGGVIEICLAETADEARAIYIQRQASGLVTASSDALLFRLSDLKPPLAARSWRKGDRMRPRGLDGSKKLQDIFVDRKISADRRGAIPVIVEQSGTEQAGAESDHILGILGVQGGEMTFPICAAAESSENIGPYLLIMALSYTSTT